MACPGEDAKCSPQILVLLDRKHARNDKGAYFHAALSDRAPHWTVSVTNDLSDALDYLEKGDGGCCLVVVEHGSVSTLKALRTAGAAPTPIAMVGPVDEDACLSAGARLCVSANPSASELDAIVRCAEASSRSLTAGPTKTTGASVSLLKRLVSAPPHAAPRPLGGAPGGQKDPVPLIEWMRINLRAAGEPGAQQTALRKALRVFTRVLTSVDEAHQRGEPLGTINPRSVAVDRLMQVSTARPDRSAPAATPLAPTPSTSRRSSSPPPAVSRVPSLSAAHRDVLSAAAHVPRGTAASDTPSEASDAPMAPASDLAYVCPSSAPAGISPPSASADVFALGVLLLDLLWHVTAPATASQSDREAFLESARERVLDPWVFERFPRESAVAMRMIHPLPCQRPSTKEVLSSPVLLEVLASLLTAEEGNRLPHLQAELQAQLRFLSDLRERRLEARAKRQQHAARLRHDIARVTQALAALLPESAGCAAPCDAGPFKRRRLTSPGDGAPSPMVDACGAGRGGEMESGEGGWSPEVEETVARRWDKLRAVAKGIEETVLVRLDGEQAGYREGWGPSPSGAVGSSGSGGGGRVGPIDDVGQDLMEFTERCGLALRSTLNHGDLMAMRSMVCSIAYDRDHEFFAMAGTSRRVKIFELSSVLDPGAYMHFPVAEIVSRSKISSLSFNPYIKGQLALANYDGAVQLHDAATQREIRMFEEHARRVWSVDSCIADPTLLASGSDDSTVKLWSMRDPASLSTLSPGSNVCSVRFSPRSSTLLAAGCADGRAYLYDLRRCDSPLARLVGHSRAVSYVSFLSPSTLVTASIDSTLRSWDISQLTAPEASGQSRARVTPSRVFQGHINRSNFVGLTMSTAGSGAIFTGSEDHAIYAYHPRMPVPMFHHSLKDTVEDASPATSKAFVSALAWSDVRGVLLAASSLGAVQAFVEA